MELRGAGECDKPGCEEDARKTYYGPDNNALRLCERHYYRLVTDGGTSVGEITSGTSVTDITTRAAPDLDDWEAPPEGIADLTDPDASRGTSVTDLARGETAGVPEDLEDLQQPRFAAGEN